MRKPGGADADRYFARSQKKDDKVIRQKEKTERDRDSRMARLRDLRLAREAGQTAEVAADETPVAETPVAEQPERKDEWPESPTTNSSARSATD